MSVEPVYTYKFNVGWYDPDIQWTMRSIVADVARKYGLTVEALRGPSRIRSVSWPRQEAMWRMINTKRYSLPQVGRFFNRDHTTVLHGWRQVEKRRALARAA